MVTSDSLAGAAGRIWDHWQAGTAMDRLPGAMVPVSRRDGYVVQSLIAARSSRPPAGWKIAATSEAGQRHIGVSGPLAGRILAERVFNSGDRLDLAPNRMRVAEPEFAFRVGTEIRPRSGSHTVESAVAAMDALIPAIEVPDSRFVDFARAGEVQLIADLACAHELVLGTSVEQGWQSIDLSQHPVHCTVAGRYERDGLGRNVLGDPRLALVWILNELADLGITIPAGEIITSGTCAQPLAIEPGDHVTADFGPLGIVEARFA